MFKNVASQSIALFAFDITTGAPKTGDAANMVFYITKDWGSVTAIASNSGVPTEMDATNAKGWYKIAVSQAETNADEVVLTGKSSTANVSVTGREVSTFASQSGDSYARLGAPAGASIAADLAEIEGETDTIVTNTTGITFTVSNQVDVNVVDWKGAAAPAMTGDAFARLGAPAGASIAADLAEIEAETDGIAAIPTTTPLTAAQIATGVWQDATAGDFTAANSIGKSVMNGVSLGTGLTINAYTGNTAQTGDAYARLGAPAGASIAADLAEIEGETDTLLAGVTVTTNSDKTGYSLAAGGLSGTAYVPPTTALTESYSALHAAPSVAQLLFEIRSLLAEKSVATTTLTAKKVDGSTTSMTFTLNDATAPSSITRAS